MRPIQFSCESSLAVPRREIFEGLRNPKSWDSFTGYGLLPGIRKADYLEETERVVGSSIRVENTDGSTHLERILEWSPEERVVMELVQFSPPLSGLAWRIVERWSFFESDGSSRVRRDLTLHPRNAFAFPILWLISLLLRQAISRHLRVIATGAEP